MNGVFIVPTGIGAEIGGHSGDATPAAKLIASVCDTLIVHPNVVNASDINEMTENMLYVEGSMLDRMLEGHIGLEEATGNKILVAVNAIDANTVNAVSAARAVMGADVAIVELAKPIIMTANLEGGRATGNITNAIEAADQISQYVFDVLVVNTPIAAEEEAVRAYITGHGGVNLWGGVEARLSKLMSEQLNRPVIHSPIESELFKTFSEIVDPRKAAEMVSVCYLHCCLKGAFVAPQLTLDDNGLWNTDIDFMITPINVFGRPHKACVEAGIPVIAVKENTTVLNDPMPDSFIIAESYLEAAGIISAMKAGLTLESVRRPLSKTQCYTV